VNKAQLIGNLGQDPEIRITNTGARVAHFSLATTDRWKDRTTGEKREKTEWHRVTIWNEALVKIVEQFCRKGSKIFLEGQIQTRDFTDKDGSLRKATEIVIQAFNGMIELLDARHADGAREQSPEPAHQGARVSLKDRLDDDIPFAPEWR
jgi:single-strand DNA-binding protein